MFFSIYASGVAGAWEIGKVYDGKSCLLFIFVGVFGALTSLASIQSAKQPRPPWESGRENFPRFPARNEKQNFGHNWFSDALKLVEN